MYIYELCYNNDTIFCFWRMLSISKDVGALAMLVESPQNSTDKTLFPRTQGLKYNVYCIQKLRWKSDKVMDWPAWFTSWSSFHPLDSSHHVGHRILPPAATGRVKWHPFKRETESRRGTQNVGWKSWYLLVKSQSSRMINLAFPSWVNQNLTTDDWNCQGNPRELLY